MLIVLQRSRAFAGGAFLTRALLPYLAVHIAVRALVMVFPALVLRATG